MTDTATTATYERDLTPAEIAERTALRDKLDDERDDLIKGVEQRRLEIRGLNASRRKIESRLLDVRREIRSGKVIESRQTTLPFEGHEARHGEGELLDPIELRHLITCVRPRELWPSVEDVERWHEDVRADVQRWCRAEHAKKNPIAGLPLPQPPATGMPNVLENIAFKGIPGPKRPSKRKAGAAKPAKKARRSKREARP